MVKNTYTVALGEKSIVFKCLLLLLSAMSFVLPKPALMSDLIYRK